ncbi:MAG: protein kinase [Alphaproteobacteria bacterium]|nr:protein kinase [Alphaproteobacteria bacterium]
MRLPAVLGKYELIERLATGGMAEVFLARAKGPAGVQKTLVVKRIRPEYADDPRFVNMFINEARIGVHLAHPNIVHVFELGRAAGTWFIAMEYLHGRDLTRILRRLRSTNDRLPDAVSVYVVAELLRGLHHAHSRTDEEGKPLGLIHQDVSPHNVLLGFDGEVKLLDFGIARAVNSDEDSGTPAGRGKFAYSSPESAAGGTVDHRSDLYSAGVTLWELLAGARPYQGLDPATKMARVREGDLPSLSEARPDLDPELVAIVARATQPRPADRHPTAADFEEDLRAWLYETGARVGSSDVSEWTSRLFPDVKRPAVGLPVRQLAEDLEKLDTEVAPTPSPRVALPGKLQQSPGERKQVAVLVLDVDGLTELSARIEPEQFAVRHFRLLRWIHRIVDRWGGVIQRAVDDHIFILFGVPRTREDDLSRAMDCALELQTRKGELQAKGLQMEFCIGLHAGEVTVGISRTSRVQYLARGNTTRLARRLSASADHEQILVSQRVLTSMVADFRLRQGPMIPSRGGKDHLPSYLLEGRRVGIRTARRGPFLRRGEEIDQLIRAVERLATGQGAALALLGPLGSGKSRLVREVQQLAQRRTIPFHVVRCDPWGGGQAFRELVQVVLDIGRDAPDAEIRSRIAREGELSLTERQVEVLAWIAGAENGTTPEKSEVVLALEGLVRGLTEGGAAILALEAEGMGPRDLAILAQLVRQTHDAPVLYLVVWRPPLPEALAEVCEPVVLGAFDEPAQERFIKALLEVETLDDALMEVVSKNCEGNPLYIEEMVKYLLQREQLVVHEGTAVLDDDAIDLPDSLHSLISARIDALDAASKGILQLAAVIGTTFTGAVLARAAGLDDPSPLLMELVARGLVVRNEDGWALTTELVREAALRGILGVQRRDYHRLVAEAIEAVHADALDRHADALALHCSRGGRPVDAARYAQISGLGLERAGRLEEAREMYERGLQWMGEAPNDPDLFDIRVQGEASLNLKSGSVSMLLGDHVRGARSLSLALDIASDAGLPWIEVRCHLQLGRSYLERGDLRLANAHLASARAMIPMDDEPDIELEALEASATLAFEQGRNDEAEELWKAVLERAEHDPALAARCQIGLANRWIRTNDLERAQPLLRSALRAARKAKDRILEGRVLNNIGLLYSWSGRPDDALFYYRRALEVREGIGYSRGVVINHHNVGDVHFQKGHWSRAHVAFSRSRELAERIGWERGVVLNEVYLAFIEATRGEDGALPKLRVATQKARDLGDPEILTTGSWLVARHLMETGSDEARPQLDIALADAQRWQLMPMVSVIREAIDRLEGGEGLR